MHALAATFTLATFMCLRAFAAVAITANQPPEILPALKVAANVPLIKVAEHRMREPRFATAAIAYRGAIYIAGGLNSNGTTSKTIERFDIATGRTEIVAQLRVGRLWHCAVVVDDKLYVLGGNTFGAAPNSLKAVSGIIAAARKEGGGVPPSLMETGRHDLERSVEIIDLATGTVALGPPMPDARNQFGCVYAGGKIYVLGGVRDDRGRRTITNTTLVLDLASKQWRSGPPMPQIRAGSAVLVDGGFIVAPGGYNGTRAIREVDVFNPRNETWSTIPELCSGMSAHSTVFLGQHMFLFGAYDNPELLLAYNLKTKTSETFTLGYTATRHTAVVVCDGLIYVIGGRANRDSDPMDLIQVFAPTKSVARSP